MEIDFLLEDEKKKMEQAVLGSFPVPPFSQSEKEKIKEKNEKDEIEEKNETSILDNTLSDNEIKKAVTVDLKKKKSLN